MKPHSASGVMRALQPDIGQARGSAGASIRGLRAWGCRGAVVDGMWARRGTGPRAYVTSLGSLARA